MVETASRITEERVDVDDLMKALCNTWNAGIFLTLDPGHPNQKMKKLKRLDKIKRI
jgi:SAM-dependent MidA family methyltransferase